MEKKILEIIYDTIDEVNESNPDEMKLAKSLKTIIIGNGGVLDSLGIINFIISLENKLDNEFATIINLQDDGLLDMKDSPLHTVNSLVNYIIKTI